MSIPSEQQLRECLRGAAFDVTMSAPAIEQLTHQVKQKARRAQTRRRRAAAGAVLCGVAASGAVAVGLGPALSSRTGVIGSTAQDPYASWPVRGSLADETAWLNSFMSHARERDPVQRVLFAGDVPGGRVVLSLVSGSHELRLGGWAGPVQAPPEAMRPTGTAPIGDPVVVTSGLHRDRVPVVAWAWPSPTNSFSPFVVLGPRELTALEVSAKPQFSQDGLLRRHWAIVPMQDGVGVTRVNARSVATIRVRGRNRERQLLFDGPVGGTDQRPAVSDPLAYERSLPPAAGRDRDAAVVRAAVASLAMTLGLPPDDLQAELLLRREVRGGAPGGGGPTDWYAILARTPNGAAFQLARGQSGTGVSEPVTGRIVPARRAPEQPFVWSDGQGRILILAPQAPAGVAAVRLGAATLQARLDEDGFGIIDAGTSVAETATVAVRSRTGAQLPEAAGLPVTLTDDRDPADVRP